MSIGARHGTTLQQLEAQFVRLTGLGLFHFPRWYADQVRALKASMGNRFPSSRAKHELVLLDVLRSTPVKTP